MPAPESHVLEHEGLRLHVAAYEGPADSSPFLLMHGGMAHGAWWAPLARALGAKVRPFALDRRGHGQSDWADVDRYGWSHDLEDAERVARALDPRAVAVGGDIRREAFSRSISPCGDRSRFAASSSWTPPSIHERRP